MPVAEIFGMKYLHQGTVMDLPYVMFAFPPAVGPPDAQLLVAPRYYSAFHQFSPVVDWHDLYDHFNLGEKCYIIASGW